MKLFTIILVTISLSSYSATQNNSAEEKNTTPAGAATREPASITEPQGEAINAQDAEKLANALDEIDTELRQLHTGRPRN